MTPGQMDSYFRRIGWRPASEAGPAVLRELHFHHPGAFPFENLDPLLGNPVALDTGALCDKMLSRGRGGYCFEQNRLMAEVLRTLGFSVRYLAARVLWNNPPDTLLPRTHMLLMVDCAGEPWLVDVGFGGLTPRVPLRLNTGAVQQGGSESFCLTEESGLYTLCVNEGGQWQAMYRFDLQPQEAADLEMMNWYVASHPQSRFIRQLMAARREDGKRYALLDNRLTTYRENGGREEILLETPGSLKAALRDQLRIRLPETDALDSLLAGLIRQGQNI